MINSNLALQLSDNQFVNTNLNLNEDTLLICTGREAILISSYEYFTNNKIVEVESDVSDQKVSYCPIDTAIEPTKLDPIKLSVVLFSRGYFTNVSERLRVLFNVLTQVKQTLTRAPPKS